MALGNQGVKEKYLTPVEWEILLCLLFIDKKWKLLNYKHRINNNNNNNNNCVVKDFIQLKESRLNKIRILKQQCEKEENKNE